MDTLKQAWNRLSRGVLVILLLGLMWLAPNSTALAVSADYNYSAGAPDQAEAKEKTLYQGRRTVVNAEQPQADTTGLINKIDRDLDKVKSDRPKTTGEWNREARETQGQQGKRVGRIAKESAEAVKDFGKMYPDTAERSGDALQESLDKSN